MSERCFSCGGAFETVPDGATHAYMLSTPGCWSTFGAVLAREYSDPVLFDASHRLSVDAYAIQHPGLAGERRAVQSVWLHAASLWLVLKQGVDHAVATSALKRLVSHTPPDLPKTPVFSVTHADVMAHCVAEHMKRVREWARAALDDWSELHEEIERLAAKARE